MLDWLVDLEKHTRQRGEPVGPREWTRVEREAGLRVPPEVKELYEEMNGATLEGDVALFPLWSDGRAPAVLSLSKKPPAGLPQDRVWCFGSSPQGWLFAAEPRALRDAKLPRALASRPWVFGVSDGARFMHVVASLDELLHQLLPNEDEPFGETTYARAFNVVQGALGKLAATAPAPTKAKRAPKPPRRLKR